MNSSVIGTFIGCLARANIEREEIIQLSYNVFNQTWLEGLKNAVLSMDQKLRILLPKVYMASPLGSLRHDSVARRPSLYIMDNIKFFLTWPKMEACINFLLC